MDGSRMSKREMIFRFVHKVPPLVYESGISFFFFYAGEFGFEIPPCRFDVLFFFFLVIGLLHLDFITHLGT